MFRATTDIWSGEALQSAKDLSLEMQHLKTDVSRGGNAFAAQLLPHLVTTIRFIRTEGLPTFLALKEQAMVPVREFIQTALLPALEGMLPALAGLVENVKGLYQAFKSNPFFQEVVSVLRDQLWPLLRDLIIPMWVDFMENKLTLIKGVYDNVLKPAFDAILVFFQEFLVPLFRDEVIPAIREFAEMVMPLIAAVWTDTVQPAIQAFVDTLRELFDLFTVRGPEVGAMSAQMGGSMGASFTGIMAALKPVLDAFKEIAVFIWPLVKETWEEGLRPALEQLLEFLQKILNSPAFKTFVEVAVVVLKTLAVVLQTTLEIFLRIFSLIINLITGDWADAWADLKAIAKEALDFVLDILNLWGITDLFKSIWEGISEFFKGWAKGLIGSWVTVVNAVISLVNKIIEAWNGLNFKVPSFSMAGRQFGGQRFGVGRIGTIPDVQMPRIAFLGEGGIVTEPTLAVVGENGPEAVVPLNRAGGRHGRHHADSLRRQLRHRRLQRHGEQRPSRGQPHGRGYGIGVWRYSSTRASARTCDLRWRAVQQRHSEQFRERSGGRMDGCFVWSLSDETDWGIIFVGRL